MWVDKEGLFEIIYILLVLIKPKLVYVLGRVLNNVYTSAYVCRTDCNRHERIQLPVVLCVPSYLLLKEGCTDCTCLK